MNTIMMVIMAIATTVTVFFPQASAIPMVKQWIMPHYESPATSQMVGNEDGELISLEEIKEPHTPETIKTYRMMYWSEGKKVEAYVAAPNDRGDYPLLVNLHGGYTQPIYDMHVTELDVNSKSVALDDTWIDYSESGVITIAPMYQGYGDSDGVVQGISDNTIDAQNAIKALRHYLDSSKHFPHIETGHVYVEGSSMGGGVALKLASERTDILSVIALSPFVGWDIVGEWDRKNNQGHFQELEFAYGPFSPDSPKIKKDSIDFDKITAPTLLIQGTADPNVEWETVQSFYQKMKEDHKEVTFKLVKGGNHCLSNKQDQLNQFYRDWYDAYSQD